MNSQHEIDFAEKNSSENGVGPVLKAGIMTDAMVKVLRELNPEISVLDRGSYIRVSCPHTCLLSKEKIEHYLGHSFSFPGDLEMLMVSFQGNLKMDQEQVSWSDGLAKDAL